MRQYLVFIRAGRHSLHRTLLDDDPGRSWDCCVNAWAGPAQADLIDPDVEIFQDDSINKFEAFLAWMQRAGRRYRYCLLLDDDLLFAPGDVSRFFEWCERASLFVSQPAIAWGSHANHLINIRNPACRVRRVNFVEVMAPCFSQAALDALMEQTFLLTKCTWGIDYAWSSMLQGQGRLSVVDAIAMQHTKPMDRSGGPFYDMLRRQGIEPEEELAEVHRLWPRWGDMRTEPTGHHYRWPLPESFNQSLVQRMERRKIVWHLARHGTIVAQRAIAQDAEQSVGA